MSPAHSSIRSTVNHIDEEARNKTMQFNDFKTQMSEELRETGRKEFSERIKENNGKH